MAANNNVYSIAIPASAGLADATAATVSRNANGIAAGDQRQMIHLTDAVRETRIRQNLKVALEPPLFSVTSDEVAASVLRQHTIATEILAGQNQGHLGAGAPAWGTQLQQQMQAIQQQMQALQQQMQANQQATLAIQQQMQAMQANQQATLAMTQNERARRLNASSEESIIALRKVNPGLGNQLPGQHGQVPAGAVPAVGDQCPFYPANFTAFEALTHARLGDLSIFFNDDFGIVEADTLAIRKRKFHRFTTR